MLLVGKKQETNKTNMGSYSFSLSMFINVLSLFHIPLTCAFSATLPPLCHDDETSALLQFKESFIINMHASDDPFAYPKVDSWKLEAEGEEQSDCCSWVGVQCDTITGHVIGLDLSSSGLYGSIKSGSSLFQLPHLRHLNLAYNHFNYSPIPAELVHLSKLTYLNLSHSALSGQIPLSFSKLSTLSSLDLSENHKLILKNPDFGTLVQNLTNLKALDLDSIDISSSVPDILANLSSLNSISLINCGLYGEFPVGFLELPNLQILQLSMNWDLNGPLPNFNLSSPLQSLEMSHTGFFGVLPASIGNLGSLNTLDIWDCNFFGRIPVSLGNLTQLAYFDLSDNNFEGQNFSSLSWIGQKTKLSVLGLDGISLNGEIPIYFANLTHLEVLFLESCQITGPIPSWLIKMTQLLSLLLPSNKLEGPIPGSVFQLKNLEILDLSFNNLNGTVEWEMFLNLQKLNWLLLSGNNLSLLLQANTNSTFQKFATLGLGSCKLQYFPYFLRDQDKLQWLDLSSNEIHGPIPNWLVDTTKDTMELVDLSRNCLTGFELRPSVIPWSQVQILDLRFNMLQGSLPMPPPSTKIYLVSNNNLTGEISPLICSLNSLYALDLSNNNLSGKLPRCLENFGASLELLNLGRNMFDGKIPRPQTVNCNLKMLVLDKNQFGGKIPRSLANCGRLEFLILGNNQMDDVFPSWLGALQELKVLILRSNQFHGVLRGGGSGITNSEFPKLRIIDLSQNNFSGQLPYFANWNAMKIAEADSLTYMVADLPLPLPSPSPLPTVDSNYSYSMTINNKGINRLYVKVLEFFIAIDFSSNRFEGKIPKFIGNLKGLRSLNLANNLLIGCIPSTLGNLSKLESLDLSQNKLSGEIPQELTQLTFLSFFNVSHNHLRGSIPQGKQFGTFDSNSYEGNSDLCGSPSSKKCEILKTNALPPPQSSEGDDSGSPFEFDWKPVVMGYASGFIVGLAIGRIAFKKRREWFLKIFGTRQQRMRIRSGTRRQRN